MLFKKVAFPLQPLDGALVLRVAHIYSHLVARYPLPVWRADCITGLQLDYLTEQTHDIHLA